MAIKNNVDEVILVLVLGDGDFSYSLDLASHLVNSQAAFEYSRGRSFHLVATGFDSHGALVSKYKNSSLFLTKLEGMHESPLAAAATITATTKKQMLRVSLHHNVNAITTENAGIPPATHVVFNHPHLGTENAALHARFLCHLFHSVKTVWLTGEAGYFHLTLVQGQFERWNCQAAAAKHNMVLIDSRPFRAPRVGSPYYQRRRHQTGKSFASRAPEGSIAFTFRRETIKLGADATVPMILACLLDLKVGEDNPVAHAATNNNHAPDVFVCPHCRKSFQEERSRDCHVRAVHEKKRKRDIYSCPLCLTTTNPHTGAQGPRIFPTAQALQDHNKAKHLGKYESIKPDWCSGAEAVQVLDTSNVTHKSCEICGLPFQNSKQEEYHKQEFLPSGDLTAGREGLTFVCPICKKTFRDQRAQKQHENFCLLSTKSP
jgi:uncharacterized C2H2 Zn-finger protein